MRIMLSCDASKDGLDVLQRLVVSSAGALNEREQDTIVTFVLGWPPHEGWLVRYAIERQAVVDDFHRAFHETVEDVRKRLGEIAGPLSEAVESRPEDGDAVEQLVGAVERERVDMLIVGTSGGSASDFSHAILTSTIARVQIPVVIAYGIARI